MNAKPRITPQPDGPYHLQGDAPVQRTSGAACPTRGDAWLCRCGGSKNKPFCDGTHKKNGFRGANLADPKKDRRVTYPGRKITIFDNRSICAHSGYCTDGLKEVFRLHDDPWIVPDAAAVEDIIATIRKCPSGALSYAIGAEYEPPHRPPSVTVTDDGPYAIVGGVQLMGTKFGDGASPEHYTLCRCGASKNKPFCDGSHWDAGFKDAG